MDRREYHAAYYRRTRARRLTLKARAYWCQWLLSHLTWPQEPTPVVPKRYPTRRPMLRLRAQQ